MPYLKPALFVTCLTFAVSEASAEVTFSPPAVIETPGATADILMVDLDDDGDLDIASLEVEFVFEIGEATGLVNVALNDGAGGFSAPATFELVTVGALEFAFHRLVAADLDGDGDPDLAAIGTTSPLVLLFNDGDGGFGPVVNTGISVNLGPLKALIDAGDVDGDGDVDLAVGLPGQIATNDGTGAFTADQFTDDVNPHNLEIVDLDGDGDEDIAFGFFIHLNDGQGNFTQQEGIYPGPGAAECVFADFDGDGDPDVACARNFSDVLSIAANNGDATFGPSTDIPTITAPIDLHLGHFDADDHFDLLLTHSTGNENIGIYTGNGDGTFNDAIILASPNGTIAAAGDLDGDGLDDVVMSTTFVFSDGPIAVLLNDGQVGIPGDLDGNGVVGTADLLMLLAAWGPCPPEGDCPADLNGDGVVGTADLLTLLANWGS
jgi:hypothetical protein